MKLCKILFASDLHGSNLVFRKLMDTAIQNNVQAIIVGGDISGKTMTPIVKRPGDIYEALFLGNTRRVHGGDELTQLQEDISNTGSYPIRLTPDEYNKMHKNPKIKDQRFLTEMKKRFEQWSMIAEQKLKPHGIRLLMMCGNDDHYELDEIINHSSFAENPEANVLVIGDSNEVIGDSSANVTPFHCPRDMDEDSLEARITQKIMQITNVGQSIFVLHTPPFNSTLDNAPELDDKLRQVSRAGNPVLQPVGSKAVRKLIEKYQPLLSLHGHVHESHGFAYIGKTLCINPGSEYSNGIMRAFLITLDRDAVKGHMLITR